MDAVQAGILSLLITLSGALHDGLQAFKDGKNDEAIAALTKVVDEKSPLAEDYRTTALFYRAQARHAKKDDKNALADLVAVTRQAKVTVAMEKEAKALYAKYGGDPAKLLPSLSPKQVFQKFMEAMEKNDTKKALTFCSENGEWKSMLVMSNGQNMIQNVVVGDEAIGTGEKSGTATLNLRQGMPDDVPPEMRGMIPAIVLAFTLDRKNNKWLIEGIDKAAMAKEMQRIQANPPGARMRRNAPGPGMISNINDLKQIGLACRMYSSAYDEKFPDKLEQLKTEGFLENEGVYTWVNPANSKDRGRYIYCSGFTESDDVDSMIAASPKPYKGKRAVLFLDGHVKAIPENEFLTNAKKQKWRIPGIVKKKDIPEEKQKAIRDLVKQLGDDDFATRKNAKEKLKAMGFDAYPILEEYKNAKDPEIKMSVRDLLNGG